MTRDEILAMKPGRELDALIHESIFGNPHECKLIGQGTIDDPIRLDEPDAAWRRKSPADKHWERWSPDGAEVVPNEFMPHYSTEIEAAWKVVDHMAQTYGVVGHNHFMLERNPKNYYCEFSRPDWECAHGDTAPEAISKAALLAVLDPANRPLDRPDARNPESQA